MKMNNIVRLICISVWTIALLNACSSDNYEDASGNVNISKVENDGFNVVVQSDEFKTYDSKYAELISAIDIVTSKMSQTEKEELLNLVNLYRTDPEKYQYLLEYKTQMIVAEDSVQVAKAYYSLLNAKKALLNDDYLNDNLSKCKKMITDRLLENWSFMDQNEFSAFIKTRASESDKFSKCIELCRKQYDDDIYYANLAYGCASAANIGLCIATSGTSIVGNYWTQVSLIAAINLARAKAKTDYDNCVANCKLSYT